MRHARSIAWVRTLFAVLAASACALVPSACSDASSGSEHARAALALEPATLDFGALGLGATSGPLTLVATNTTEQALTLDAADLLGHAAEDFSLATAAPLPLRFAPGASTELAVTFTPSLGGLRQAAVPLQQLPSSILPLSASMFGVGLGPPGAELLVDCAGEEYLGEDGERWSADFGHHGASWTHLQDGASLHAPADLQLYRSSRLGADFGYAFELPAGTYEVRLHAIELWHAAPGLRRFDVTLEGQTFLDDLDLFASAGKNTAFIAAQLISVTDGRLDIDFIGVEDEATVSAIEVRSACFR